MKSLTYSFDTFKNNLPNVSFIYFIHEKEKTDSEVCSCCKEGFATIRLQSTSTKPAVYDSQQ